MDALAKALSLVFDANPAWYALGDQAEVSLHDCRTVLDWVENPAETSPETTKALCRVVSFLYGAGRLPLNDPKVAQEAMSICG